MTGVIHEYDPETGEQGEELTILGQLVGYEGPGLTGAGIYEPLNLIYIDGAYDPEEPGDGILGAALLTSTHPSRGIVNLAWSYDPLPEDPNLIFWKLEYRYSGDNGVTWTQDWDTEGGDFNIFPGDPLAYTINVPVGTPEMYLQFRVQAICSGPGGVGQFSNIVTRQWSNTPTSQPTACTSFTRDAPTTTSVNLSWAETADVTVTKHGLFVGSTLVIDNIPANALTYAWTGLTPNTVYTNVSIRRWNSVGWSPASNLLTFTTPSVPPPVFTMLMGCSSSPNAHGGTEDWDGWRVYTRNEMYQRANQAGSLRPLFLAYSEDGENLGGANPNYTTIYNHVRDELEEFYWDDTPSTPSARANIKLYWSNGNENSDKGAISGTSHTPAQIANYVTSQQALYDAVHYAPGGVRRFPNAFAGSNPTQEHERLGIVQDWLHPSARYHDFVMWSMYPPGRGVNDAALSRNPRWDWPSFQESARTNRRQGFLIRCFYRTFQAQLQARTDTGNPNFKLLIGCGETGMASNPDDRSTRPYYAVHALAGGMWILANQYGLEMPFNCWWDNATSDTAPHNELSDEPTASDHLAQGTGAAAGNNTVATNPSTRVAWQNWLSYDKRRPGSTQPAQWAGNPKSSWNFTGTQV